VGRTEETRKLRHLSKGTRGGKIRRDVGRAQGRERQGLFRLGVTDQGSPKIRKSSAAKGSWGLKDRKEKAPKDLVKPPPRTPLSRGSAGAGEGGSRKGGTTLPAARDAAGATQKGPVLAR